MPSIGIDFPRVTDSLSTWPQSTVLCQGAYRIFLGRCSRTPYTVAIMNRMRAARSCAQDNRTTTTRRRAGGPERRSVKEGHSGLSLELDFGHFPRNQIAGKWQPDEGFVAGAWEAASFGDVYLPTRLHLISGRRLPALAWSVKGRFLNGQSRVEVIS
jgi:hypothetical protein